MIKTEGLLPPRVFPTGRQAGRDISLSSLTCTGSGTLQLPALPRSQNEHEREAFGINLNIKAVREAQETLVKEDDTTASESGQSDGTVQGTYS